MLHVDIKFLTIEEFYNRVENPVVLWDTDRQLQQVIEATTWKFPHPDYQWIEDRFWIWIHYALLKVGRGEYLETLYFLGFLRMVVLGPLLHIKNGNLPKGVRKVETLLANDDRMSLESTIAAYSKKSLMIAIENSINLYKTLRKDLFKEDIILKINAENAVLKYLKELNK